MLTPPNVNERGAQLSFRPHGVTAKQIHDELEKFGVVVSEGWYEIIQYGSILIDLIV